MYQEEPVYEPFQSRHPEPQTYVGRLQAWTEDKLSRLWEFAVSAIIPVLQLIAFLVIIVALSVIFNVYLRRVMVPRALIHERVYFNYVAESPNAKIRLEAALQQWTYVKTTPQITSGQQRRFLKADSFYDIHGVFTIAKSARNYDIGASALTLKTVDASGDVVAKSVRALIIPYQHPMSLLLEALAFFPWRAVGTLGTAETVDVWVDLMRGYHEPGHAQTPTESLEIHLNAPVMDMSHAYITVMPKLRGVV